MPFTFRISFSFFLFIITNFDEDSVREISASIPFTTSFSVGQGNNYWKKGEIIKHGNWFDLRYFTLYYCY